MSVMPPPCYFAITVLTMQLSIAIYISQGVVYPYVMLLLYIPIPYAHVCIYLLFIFTLDAQHGMTSLMAAAQNNHIEAMEVLLTEYNSNINARDRVRHPFHAWVSHILYRWYSYCV